MAIKEKTQNRLDLADADFRVAGYVLKKKEYLYVLFFCQQAIEETIKAVYFKKFNETPPRKHDLVALAEAADMLSEVDDDMRRLFISLSEFYIESRYAEEREGLVKKGVLTETKEMMKKTGDALEWLRSKLR